MGALPLFPQGDPGRDRALGALLGAARGAREARRFMGGTTAADWPDAQAVMIHTAHTLLETGTLTPNDLLRRLLTDWAQGMGRPRLTRVTDPDRPQRTGHGFIAGLAVISILRKTDRRGSPSSGRPPQCLTGRDRSPRGRQHLHPPRPAQR